MYKIITILIIALFALISSAQSGNPIETDFPVFELEDALADGITIESVKYFPTFVDDPEQRSIYFLDYDEMIWKAIPYPDDLGTALIQDWEEYVTIYVGLNQYNFETQEWDEINHIDEIVYRFDFGGTDKVCGVDLLNLATDTWTTNGTSRIEDEATGEMIQVFRYCNSVTSENIYLTENDINDGCQMEFEDLINKPITEDDGNVVQIFVGKTETIPHRICKYDFSTESFEWIGDIEESYESVFPADGYESKLVAGFKKLDLAEYGYNQRQHLVDIFVIDATEETGLKQITPSDDIEVSIISGQLLEDALILIWAEAVSETEENIYLFSPETLEKRFLFSRERDNIGIGEYYFGISDSGKYIHIYEAVVSDGVFDLMLIDFYTIDGQFLHQEKITPIDKNVLAYWIGGETDTTVILYPTGYGSVQPATIIRGFETNRFEAYTIENYRQINSLFPIFVEGKAHFVMIYNDGIKLYDIENDTTHDFLNLSEAQLECSRFYNTSEEGVLKLDISDCSDPSRFRAEIKVSINQSGD